MTPRWPQDIATEVSAGRLTPLLECRLDEILIWLGNARHDATRLLDEAFARRGLDRDHAVARVQELLDRLLFIEDLPPHRILGLPANASAPVVRQRYRRLIQAFHPDRHPERSVWLTQRTELINIAYGRLRRRPAAAAAAQPAAKSTGPAPKKKPRKRPRATYHYWDDGSYAPPLAWRLRTWLGASHGFQLRFFGLLIAACLALLLYLFYINSGGAGPGAIGAAAGGQVARPALLPPMASAVGPKHPPAPASGPHPEVAAAKKSPAVTRLSNPAASGRPAQPGHDTGAELAALDRAGFGNVSPRAAAGPVLAPGPVSPGSVDDGAALATDSAVSRPPAPVAAADARTEPSPTAPGASSSPSQPGRVAASQPVTSSPSPAPPQRGPSQSLSLAPKLTERPVATRTTPELLHATVRAVWPVRHRMLAGTAPVAAAATTPGHSTSATKSPPEPRSAAPSAPASVHPTKAPSAAPGPARPQALDCGKITPLLTHYRHYYDSGRLDRFIALYSATASENQWYGRARIRRAYRQWFHATAARDLRFTLIVTQAEHHACRARIHFQVSYINADHQPVHQSGQLRLLIGADGPVDHILRVQY